jgi:hypothetical protein
MIEALLQNERIDRDFFDELLDVNKYRNLVFHGHVETADAAMIARTIQSTNRIQQMLDSLPSQQTTSFVNRSCLFSGSIKELMASTCPPTVAAGFRGDV